MGLETGVSENISSTVMTTWGGFQSARVGVEEIRALFVGTGAALDVV